MNWGDMAGGNQHPEDQDERPISTYAFMIYAVSPDGESIDGCDTKEETATMIQQMMADDPAIQYVVYQKLAASNDAARFGRPTDQSQQ